MSYFYTKYTYDFYNSNKWKMFRKEPKAWNLLTKDDFTKANYQMLYDKNYYVILRPDMI